MDLVALHIHQPAGSPRVAVFPYLSVRNPNIGFGSYDIDAFLGVVLKGAKKGWSWLVALLSAFSSSVPQEVSTSVNGDFFHVIP